MLRLSIIAAALLSLVAVGTSAEQRSGRPNEGQPSAPIEPPASGTSSSDLGRSGGVINPPGEIDPAMKRSPPPSGARMPVIPPPGTPGGDQAIKPK
jgi:hypothetical protein